MKEHIYVGSVENTSLLHTYNLNIWTIATPPPEENCPPVTVGVWVKVRVSFRVGVRVED